MGELEEFFRSRLVNWQWARITFPRNDSRYMLCGVEELRCEKEDLV